MNKFIASLAASALMLLTPTAAEAVTRDAFIERLREIGVTFTSGDCNDGMGSYKPGPNILCINDQLFAAGQSDLLDETLTHEAVHVVQDCMDPGGFLSDSLTPIITSLEESDVDTDGLKDYVSKNLRPTYIEFLNGIENYVVKTAEIEAYSLESDPDLVYKMLEAACLNNQ